ncbi:MAG: cell cycle response regulator [Fibrobacterota bacterium]|jgi:diguanylate cyclase (GGDEF)-like protein
MEITVTFDNDEVVPIQAASLNASGAVAVLSHVRYCHVLIDLPPGQEILWEGALLGLGDETLRPCREMAWLENNARATDYLLILCEELPFDLVENRLPCPSERLLVPRDLTVNQLPQLAQWVGRMATLALERQAMRRLVDRFEARIGRESNRARMADLLKEANERLQEQFVRDALTGVPNRRRFDEQIDYLWGRAVGEEAAVAVMMLDIDFFKKLNDSLGHQAGDECLQKVAQRLFEIVDGNDDLLARYGGEEFVALLWDTDVESACAMAERLRAGVEELALVNPGNTNGIVTISIGISVERPSFTSSAEEFLRHADQALYKSKETGRNRWTLHQPGDESTHPG